MLSVTIRANLEEKVVSLTRTLLFLTRPSIGNSAIPKASALCNQEDYASYYLTKPQTRKNLQYYCLSSIFWTGPSFLMECPLLSDSTN